MNSGDLVVARRAPCQGVDPWCSLSETAFASLLKTTASAGETRPRIPHSPQRRARLTTVRHGPRPRVEFGNGHCRGLIPRAGTRR